MARPAHGLSARAAWGLLLVVLIAAFGLRLWDLGAASVWHDEAWSIRAIRDPVHTPDDNTPPLYYALVHVLWWGAGETPFALRYGSVLLGLLTVALGFRVLRQWAGLDAGLLAALLLALSPLLWAYAREIRAYVAVPLLALLLLWQTDRLLRPRPDFPWRRWIGLLAAELILLYTHNLAVPVVGWLNLAVGAAWIVQRRWRALGLWAIGQAAVLLAYLPWLAGQSPSGTPLNSPPALRPALIWEIWQSYFAPLPAQLGAERALVLGSALFGGAAILAAAALLRWTPNRHARLLLSQAILLPLLATVELRAAQIDFHPRYLIAGVPAALLVVAWGAESLPAPWEARRAAIPALLALACGVSAASLTGLLTRTRYQHDDFHALAAYYARLPQDALIVIPYGWEPALEEYYADKLNIRAEMVGVPLHSSADAARQQINAALARRSGPVRVELLTWFQLPADVRGMYSCLLESAGEISGSAFVVQGISSQGYTVRRPLALADIPGAGADYGLVRLDGAAAGGGRSVCARTRWTLEQPTAADWRVAGRLLTTDPAGWIIARSDSDIRRDDQAPTSRWESGQQGEAYNLLRFPAGAPPADYTVQVTVYSAARPNGLDRLTNGVPSGTALALGSVRPAGTTELAPAGSADVLASTALADGVQLIGHDAAGGTLNPGQELRITLQWRVNGDCCTDQPWTGGTIRLRGAGWEVAQPVRAYGTFSLDWHAFVIPAEASGDAVLTVESPTVEPITLAAYRIEQADRLFAPPPYAVPVGAEFRGVGMLEGFSVGQTTVSPDQTLDLTLVWRATGTSGSPYVIFTHLLDANGQVVAQHDGQPADGARPTTSWVPGEYLVDRHALAFLRPDYRGPATLEVGFYNPETNDRVLLGGGADHLILPIEITVQ